MQRMPIWRAVRMNAPGDLAAVGDEQTGERHSRNTP